MRVNHRSGLTVVEVLLALVVLSIGLLGLAATLGLAARLETEGRTLAEATREGENRIESLWAASGRLPRCSALAAGRTDGTRASAVWTIGGTGRHRTVTVVLERLTSRGSRRDTLRTAIPCD